MKNNAKIDFIPEWVKQYAQIIIFCMIFHA